MPIYGVLMRARPALVTVLTVLLVGGVLAPAVQAAPSGAEETSVVNLEAPRVRGEAAFGRTLRADPGAWDPADVSVTYRWLRDGEPIGKAREASYDVRRADLGRRLSVQVTATHPEGQEAGRSEAVSEPTDRVRRGTQVTRARPKVVGVARYTRTVRATSGRWKVEPDRVTYRWLRDGKKVKGASSRTYRYAPGDVGHRLRVQVTSYVDGYQRSRVRSKVQGRVKHRVGVQRTATYSVATRGRISISVKEFARLAQQTFGDARGWRGKGVQFRRVASGGSFTLVLAEASTVPSFSSQCSSTYSCRVGRYVIINQTRWQQATPPWNAGGRSLRDYRHMVVNHEVGHWLGKGHASCPGAGRLAPVMMQQSKGTNGCVFNPWPTAAELR